MVLSITETLLIAIIFIALVFLLQARDIISKDGWGGRLFSVAAAFMTLSIGFRVIAEVFSLYGNGAIARQIKWAGVYIGYTVAGSATILGSILIALKSLIGRSDSKAPGTEKKREEKTFNTSNSGGKWVKLVHKFEKSDRKRAKIRSSRPILEVYNSLLKTVEKLDVDSVEVDIEDGNVFLKKK